MLLNILQYTGHPLLPEELSTPNVSSAKAENLSPSFNLACLIPVVLWFLLPLLTAG